MAAVPTVGFIGLGNMGKFMALNLLKKGRPVIAYDVDTSKFDELKSNGAVIAQNVGEVAKKSQSIITMLPNSPIVRGVYMGKGGILEQIQKGSMCIDSSTIDQSVAIEVADAVKQKGAFCVDAPVSGGVTGAQNGTLTFMVGGEKSEFDAAHPILSLMGKNIVHCGKMGNGQAVKICNNMLLAVEMIGVAETMNLGITMGLDPKLLASIINTSSGRCWSSDTYNPVPDVIPGIPSSNGYKGGFGCELMTKDLGLAQNASTNLKVPIPLGAVAHQFYRLLSQNPDYKSKDFAVIYQFFKSQTQ